MTAGNPGGSDAVNLTLGGARLEDAEALRILWDEVVTLSRDAERLALASGRLTHTIRRFVELYTQDQPNDPRPLLLELGAVLDLLRMVDGAHAELEETLSFLGFTFAPKPDPHPLIVPRAMAELQARLAPRGRRRPG